MNDNRKDGADAARAAITSLLAEFEDSICFGLGSNDPGRVFGTTRGLLEQFGEDRIFDGPTSEAAMTGFGVGAAIAGKRVIHTHQRMDFALLAMDQLVNSAAKWGYMFGDQFQVPYLVRMILGRGWGQGPTHSQNFESWMAHLPGIRVLVPGNPQDLYDSIRQLSSSALPIMVIEHRWLHFMEWQPMEDLSLDLYRMEPLISKANREPHLTMISWGLAINDCLAAREKLIENGIHSDVMQIRELDERGIDEVILRHLRTDKVLIASNSWPTASYASTVADKINQLAKPNNLQVKRLHYPDQPEPTSVHLLEDFHINASRILGASSELLGVELAYDSEKPIDQPSRYDFGPF
jgi:pyruvate dehydrogenase E1 component beta subunit